MNDREEKKFWEVYRVARLTTVGHVYAASADEAVAAALRGEERSLEILTETLYAPRYDDESVMLITGDGDEIEAAQWGAERGLELYRCGRCGQPVRAGEPMEPADGSEPLGKLDPPDTGVAMAHSCCVRPNIVEAHRIARDLRRTAELIRLRGLCHGAQARDAKGSAVSPNSPDARSLSLQTALEIASESDSARYSRAASELMETLFYQTGLRPLALYQWADRPERTEREAIELLLETAYLVEEAARHNAAKRE